MSIRPPRLTRSHLIITSLIRVALDLKFGPTDCVIHFVTVSIASPDACFLLMSDKARAKKLTCNSRAIPAAERELRVAITRGDLPNAQCRRSASIGQRRTDS